MNNRISSWALFSVWKHWLCTFLILVYTHTNYCWSTPEAENQRFPSLKGSVRVDKASLTQYVNDSISEVNHVGTQMATGELLIRIMIRIIHWQSSCLQFSEFKRRVQNDEQCWNSKWQTVSPSVGQWVSLSVGQSQASRVTKSKATAKPHCLCHC